MKEEYQYQIDESVFREKINLLMKVGLNHKRIDSAKYLLFIGLCLSLGLFFVGFNSDGAGIVIGPIFILIGLIYSTSFLHYLYQVKKYKTMFNLGVNDEVQRMNDSDGISDLKFPKTTFIISTLDMMLDANGI